MSGKYVRNPFVRIWRWYAGIYARRRDALLNRLLSNNELADTGCQTHGILIDFGCTNGTITVYASKDKQARRLSCGKKGLLTGFSSAWQSEHAEELVFLAEIDLKYFSLTGPLPVPEEGNVLFQALTRDGIYSATAERKALMTHMSDLYPLYEAGWKLAKEMEYTDVSG